jgi:hypothetical protein
MSHNVSDRASNDHVHWSRNAHRSSTPERNFGARWSARRRRASPAAAICTNATKAQSGGGQGVELTSAFGRAAEVHGRTASAAFDANPVAGILRHSG